MRSRVTITAAGLSAQDLPRQAPREIEMQESHVIEVAGQFAGAAVSHQGRFRFVAVDHRVEELEDSIWPSIDDVRRVVDHLMRTGLLPARSGMQGT